MAAYELLLLNTTIPQIQAAQSGDTYVVPRDIAFSAAALLANGTNSAPSLAFSSDTDTGIFRPTTNQLGFATAGVQAMTLDASGNLVVGDTSTSFKFDVNGSSRFRSDLNVYGSGDRLVVSPQTAGNGVLLLGVNNTNTAYSTLKFSASPIIFDIAGTERARITSGGYFKASNAGTYQNSTSSYHEIRQSTNTDTVYISNTHVTDPYGVGIAYVNATPNGTGNSFLYCSDATANRLSVRSNGGIANYQANDVNLSDQRTKKDIVAAPSYWDKIKGIEIVHFKYKDQTHDDNNVGVIAQQVEQVAPEFVDQDGWGETPEDGVPLKSIYTSDMYHAAIKALQEAMARIEQLEAKVAALEGA